MCVCVCGDSCGLWGGQLLGARERGNTTRSCEVVCRDVREALCRDVRVREGDARPLGTKGGSVSYRVVDEHVSVVHSLNGPHSKPAEASNFVFDAIVGFAARAIEFEVRCAGPFALELL